MVLYMFPVRKISETSALFISAAFSGVHLIQYLVFSNQIYMLLRDKEISCNNVFVEQYA